MARLLVASVLGLAVLAPSYTAAEARPHGSPPLSDELQEPVAVPDLPDPRLDGARKKRRVRRAGAAVYSEGWLSCGSANTSPRGLQIFPPGLFNNTNQTDYAAWRPWLYFYGYGWWHGDWEGWFTVPAGTTLTSVGNGIPLGVISGGSNLYIAGALEVYWWYTRSHTSDIFKVDLPYFSTAGTSGAYYCHYP